MNTNTDKGTAFNYKEDQHISIRMLQINREIKHNTYTHGSIPKLTYFYSKKKGSIDCQSKFAANMLCSLIILDYNS